MNELDNACAITTSMLAVAGPGGVPGQARAGGDAVVTEAGVGARADASLAVSAGTGTGASTGAGTGTRTGTAFGTAAGLRTGTEFGTGGRLGTGTGLGMGTRAAGRHRSQARRRPVSVSQDSRGRRDSGSRPRRGKHRSERPGHRVAWSVRGRLHLPLP